MKIYTLYNSDTGNMETVACNSSLEAFELAQERNRKERRTQPWRAYDERGQRIVGLYQNNDSGRFDRVIEV